MLHKVEGLDLQNQVALVGALVFLALFIFDLLFQRRIVSSRGSLVVLSAFYVLVGLLFGALVYYVMGLDSASEYYTAFFVEKSLSIDNIFIIALIFKDLAIPHSMQRRILFLGIVSAALFRLGMIAAGISILNAFSWALVIAGLFLVFLGLKGVWKFYRGGEGNHFVPSLSKVPGFLRRFMDQDTLGFFTWKGGRVVFQRLFIALFFVELADLFFALDSVPAALAITQNPVLIYSSNMFALLGLRSMFLIFSDKIHMLSKFGFFLSLTLIFIGGKIVLSSLFGLHIPPLLSFVITFSLISLGILFSFIKRKNNVAS